MNATGHWGIVDWGQLCLGHWNPAQGDTLSCVARTLSSRSFAFVLVCSLFKQAERAMRTARVTRGGGRSELTGSSRSKQRRCSRSQDWQASSEATCPPSAEKQGRGQSESAHQAPRLVRSRRDVIALARARNPLSVSRFSDPALGQTTLPCFLRWCWRSSFFTRLP